MNRRISKPPALLLALTLILSLLPTALAAPARSESDPAESNALRATGLLPILPHGGKLPGETDKKDDDTVRGALPAAYDSRDYGYITPVRDQGSYNTCWTFSTAAACEAYMIKHGVEVGDTGVAADQSLNLSEYHLAWYTYTAAYDAEEMLTGDNTAFLSSANTNFLDHGGTGELVSYPLMRWTGLAAETEPALMYSSASSNGLGADYAYQYNVAHVQSAKHFFGENIDEVKRHIMEYGAGAMGVRVSNQSGTAYHGGVNTSNGTICWKQNAVAYQDANFYYADHDVTVVGWDDNYPKENFNNGYRPSQNGAWIIKNSWGTGIGVDGYFYVSYEDSATRASYVSFFTVEGVDNYDHNYQYDGSANYSCWEELSTGDAIAQEFVAGGSETLNAVAIGMCGDDTDYTLKIYTDCTPGDPTAGVLAHSQTGNIDYWGYQTVPLDSPVTLSQGQRFSVVFEFEGSDILPLYDASYSENQYYNMQVTHQPHPNTAYLKRAADSAWTDMSGDRNYRVKAYTRDIPEEPVPMSLSCYALGSLYQTISGTAGDKIHLPSTAPAAEGWSFLGWVAAPLEETVEKPVFYKPGASYKLTASVSAVYALYLRAEPIDAPVTYELVTAVPSTWEGKYVFTCMNTTGSAEYVMYGVAGDANIENTSSARVCFGEVIPEVLHAFLTLRYVVHNMVQSPTVIHIECRLGQFVCFVFVLSEGEHIRMRQAQVCHRPVPEIRRNLTRYIAAETVDTDRVHPPVHRLQHLVAHILVLVVEFGDIGPIVLNHQVTEAVAIVPSVVLGPFAVRRRVVGYPVEDHLEPLLVGGSQEMLEVGTCTELGVDGAVVDDRVITAERTLAGDLTDRLTRHHPDDVDTVATQLRQERFGGLERTFRRSLTCVEFIDRSIISELRMTQLRLFCAAEHRYRCNEEKKCFFHGKYNS